MKRYTHSEKREKALHPVMHKSVIQARKRYLEREKNKQRVETAKRDYLRKRIISLERKERRLKTKVEKAATKQRLQQTKVETMRRRIVTLERKEARHKTKMSKLIKTTAQLTKNAQILAYLRYCKNRGKAILLNR